MTGLVAAAAAGSAGPGFFPTGGGTGKDEERGQDHDGGGDALPI